MSCHDLCNPFSRPSKERLYHVGLAISAEHGAKGGAFAANYAAAGHWFEMHASYWQWQINSPAAKLDRLLERPGVV